VRARWLYKLAQPKRDRERERERERKRATSGRLKESGGVCDCVIGVLSLPLFRLRLNHATQKQKRERERCIFCLRLYWRVCILGCCHCKCKMQMWLSQEKQLILSCFSTILSAFPLF